MKTMMPGIMLTVAVEEKKSYYWYNPPYSQIIKTNVGKECILLVTKWFMANPSLKSKFNTSTLKISYSAFRNMKAFINVHNQKMF